MDALWKDLRYAARMLGRNPGFTLVAVLALGIGIGATSTIFTFLNGFVFSPVPFENPDEIVTVREIGTPRLARGSTGADFLNWKEHSQSFRQLATYRYEVFNMTSGETPERIEGFKISGNFFDMLRVKPSAGRLFTERDDAPGAPPVVLVSESLWQRRFGGKPDLVGRSLMLNGQSHTVVGIVPDSLRFPDSVGKLWTPVGDEVRASLGDYTPVIGRLKPGVPLAAVREEMTSIVRRVDQPVPDNNQGWRVRVITLANAFIERGPGPVLNIIAVSVLFVLLIACANVANLQLVRAAERGKEIAIRLALGARRIRIFRQMLVESLLLAALGGTASILVANWSVKGLIVMIPLRLRPFQPITVDGRVLLFTAVLALLTGVLFGLAPAIQAVRGGLNETLKEGGRTSSTGGHSRLRRVLVIAEVVPAVVLLIGAALLIKSFARMSASDPGYRTANTLIARVTLPQLKYSKPEQRAHFVAQAVERISALPGINGVGADSGYRRTPFLVSGRPAPPADHPLVGGRRTVTPGWFRALDIPLVAGRHFNEQDTRESLPVAIVNQTMAKRFWPGEDPVGRQVKVFNIPNVPAPWLTIVGVVRDSRADPRMAEILPDVYLPFEQDPGSSMTFMLHTASTPETHASALRAEMRDIDSDVAVSDLQSFERLRSELLAPQSIPILLITIFGGIALALAAMGLYGVISYSVTQRTHELGLRMTLGADRRDVVGLVLKQGVRLALTGAAIGLVIAYFTTRFLTVMLYGMNARDPLVFAFVPAVLVGVAALASYVPARRAAKVDPIVALHYE